MPLYTYVVTYEGVTYVTQGRHSNFKGFPTWFADLPAAALPGLTPALWRQVNPYAGEFEPIPNQQRVWRKTLTVDSADLTIIAIETKA